MKLAQSFFHSLNQWPQIIWAHALRFNALLQLLIEWMLAQCVGIAEDDELHAGTGDGYVHAAQVAQKTDLALVVGTHQADENHVALLTLEAIYGVDGDEDVQRT